MKPFGCEETYGMIEDKYLKCGQPTVALIQHMGRMEGPYEMCQPCMIHNVMNREAEIVSWLNKTVRDELNSSMKDRSFRERVRFHFDV